MKSFIAAVLLMFTGMLPSAAGQTDTLKVLVLSPGKVSVDPACLALYKATDSLILAGRVMEKSQLLAGREEHQEAYNRHPEYTRKMFENELAFLDSINVDNYLAYLCRDYISRRLYQPYKIRQRLVLAFLDKLPAGADSYRKITGWGSNTFIINFPEIRIYKEADVFVVTTKTEVYSTGQQRVIFSKELTGNTRSREYDVFNCTEGSLDCALINSVYDNLYDCLKLIAGAQQ